MENVEVLRIHLRGFRRFSRFSCFWPTLLETAFVYRTRLKPPKTPFSRYKRRAVTITIARISSLLFEPPSTFCTWCDTCVAQFRCLEIVDSWKQVSRFRIDLHGKRRVFTDSPQGILTIFTIFWLLVHFAQNYVYL